MNGAISQAPVVAEQTPLAAEQRRVPEPKRQHEEELLDEALRESFPASDPPSSWAGADPRRAG